MVRLHLVKDGWGLPILVDILVDDVAMGRVMLAGSAPTRDVLARFVSELNAELPIALERAALRGQV